MIKVWWVLQWDQYYPDGALNNVHSTWETEEEAKAQVELLQKTSLYDYIEYENVSSMLGLTEE